MKVLITGGAGYIGSELCASLVKNDKIDEIIVYDNLSRGNYNLFIGDKKLGQVLKFVKADVLDSRRLRAELEKVDTVVHLAATVTTPFADQNPHFFEQINHWGTAELVYAIEDSESIKRVIHLSSASVYGASSEQVDRSSTPNPKTFYGLSKLRGENHVARLLGSDKKAYIIRCGNIFGFSESMRFDSVINRFIFDAHFQGKISIHGSGEQHRSFVHVDRVKDIISNLIFEDLNSGTYNLVDSTLAINDVAGVLKMIYPDLEMIYMDQMAKMRELKVLGDQELMSLSDIEIGSLEERLVDFKKRLAF